MGRITPSEVLAHADTAHAVEIGERIWWVGHHIDGDPFQCHAYLVESDDESMLIDPGGLLTFPSTLAKIAEVMPFDRIRWFVCQHQDPDIAAALPEIDRMVRRDDAAVVTHWRAEALLKHYALRMPFWLVDEHSWQIDLGGRVLRFVLTPYLHFPGAFVTFDDRTGILFSSDLFGGFSDDWSLMASDESCFDAIRPFHEHYMPSRDILTRGLARLDPLPIRMIAPQHGSLIPEDLVAPTVERLADIECGLYLMVDQDTDIRRLSQMNEMLRQVLGRLMVSLDFEEIASGLLEVLRSALPVSSVEFYAFEDDGGGVRFEPTTRYRGTSEQPPEEWAALRGIAHPLDARHFPIVRTPPGASAAEGGDLVVPLFSPSTEKVEGLVVIHLDASVTIGETTAVAFAQMSGPLLVALEREQLLRASELRREEFYQLATHDPLTGLHSRAYLLDATDRLFALDDRMTEATLSLTMIDLDRFKRVNDSHGHAAGDEVLRRVATVLQDSTRGADVAVRFGGEEFLLLQMTPTIEEAREAVERVRASISVLEFERDLAGENVTASAGLAMREAGESFEQVLVRADRALYSAKEAGRDRLVVA